MEVDIFRNILTGDDSWFMLEFQHTVKWSLSREDVSKRARRQIGTKIILIVIWGVDGFHVAGLMSSQRSFNSEYFVRHLLAPIAAKVFPWGEFHILVDHSFTWITTKSTFHRVLE
jgi:hypothetical protein